MADEPLIKQLLRHQGLFMGYLVAMTHDLGAAEEVFQNVAVVVLEQGPKETIRDFQAWAKEIVRRQALHYLREKGQAQRRSMAPELLEGLSLTLDSDAGRGEGPLKERDALAQCLKVLPPRSRRIMSLRYEQRRSFEEIGAVLESSAQAIQRAISRIRQSLQDCVRTRLEAAEGAGRS
ncbi:MAG TPA: sigma-70 family RNA polymerase sigma factor [Planctomycetota bacterium]|jgi:RNA polymerase sigma-70 factor (ECF subfamily)|nr:sigma-70 family RNA polymerase sigma factor [Planctomycetota bacterium]